MKKFLGKLLSMTMVMVLVLGLAVSVQARELPEFPEFPSSFDFEAEMELSLEVSVSPWATQLERTVFDALESGVSLNVSGTVVTDDLAMFAFYEYVFNVPAYDLSLTIRYWIDMNFNDMENPRLVYILEIPLMLRMLLAAEVPGFGLGTQFIVVDAGEFVGDFMEMIENELAAISFSEEDLEDFIAEMLVVFEDAIGGLSEALAWIWSEIGQYTTFNFDHNFEELNNGYAVSLDFDVVIDDGNEFVSLDFSFFGQVTNLNSATRVALPELSATNSFDLVQFILDNL